MAVVVELERKQGRTIDIPVSDIALRNVPRGYEVDFGELESVELTVMGTSADLADLNMDEIAVTLDLDGYSREEGEYTETLDVTLPGSAYSLMDEAQVEFELVRSTGNGGSTAGDTGNSSEGSETSGGSSGTGTGSASDGEEDGDSTDSGPGTGTGGSTAGEPDGSGSGGSESGGAGSGNASDDSSAGE